MNTSSLLVEWFSEKEGGGGDILDGLQSRVSIREQGDLYKSLTNPAYRA